MSVFGIMFFCFVGIGITIFLVQVRFGLLIFIILIVTPFIMNNYFPSPFWESVIQKVWYGLAGIVLFIRKIAS